MSRLRRDAAAEAVASSAIDGALAVEAQRLHARLLRLSTHGVSSISHQQRGSVTPSLIEESLRRLDAAPPSAPHAKLRLSTFNGGGLKLRVREAIKERPSLRGLVDGDSTSLVYSASSSLQSLLERFRLGGSTLVVLTEIHLGLCAADADRLAALRRLMTSGAYEGWRLVESLGSGDRGDWSGVLIWYDSAVWGVPEGRPADGEVLCPGRLLLRGASRASPPPFCAHLAQAAMTAAARDGASSS